MSLRTLWPVLALAAAFALLEASRDARPCGPVACPLAPPAGLLAPAP